MEKLFTNSVNFQDPRHTRVIMWSSNCCPPQQDNPPPRAGCVRSENDFNKMAKAWGRARPVLYGENCGGGWGVGGGGAGVGGAGTQTI